MHHPKFNVFLLLASCASTVAYLRGLEEKYLHMPRILQAGDGKVCNETDLATRLNGLESKAECAGDVFTNFKDMIDESAFAQRSAEDQAKVVKDFCTTECGKSFDETVADWRTSCSNGSVRRLDPDDDLVPSLGDVITKFGCTKVSEDGPYCSVLAQAAADFSGEAWEEADESAVCPFFNSCCFGEMLKLNGNDETLVTDADVKCPGSEDQSTQSCPAT